MSNMENDLLLKYLNISEEAKREIIKTFNDEDISFLIDKTCDSSTHGLICDLDIEPHQMKLLNSSSCSYSTRLKIARKTQHVEVLNYIIDSNFTGLIFEFLKRDDLPKGEYLKKLFNHEYRNISEQAILKYNLSIV